MDEFHIHPMAEAHTFSKNLVAISKNPGIRRLTYRKFTI